MLGGGGGALAAAAVATTAAPSSSAAATGTRLATRRFFARYSAARQRGELHLGRADVPGALSTASSPSSSSTGRVPCSLSPLHLGDGASTAPLGPEPRRRRHSDPMRDVDGKSMGGAVGAQARIPDFAVGTALHGKSVNVRVKDGVFFNDCLAHADKGNDDAYCLSDGSDSDGERPMHRTGLKGTHVAAEIRPGSSDSYDEQQMNCEAGKATGGDGKGGGERKVLEVDHPERHKESLWGNDWKNKGRWNGYQVVSLSCGDEAICESDGKGQRIARKIPSSYSDSDDEPEILSKGGKGTVGAEKGWGGGKGLGVDNEEPVWGNAWKGKGRGKAFRVGSVDRDDGEPMHGSAWKGKLEGRGALAGYPDHVDEEPMRGKDGKGKKGISSAFASHDAEYMYSKGMRGRKGKKGGKVSPKGRFGGRPDDYFEGRRGGRGRSNFY